MAFSFSVYSSASAFCYADANIGRLVSTRTVANCPVLSFFMLVFVTSHFSVALKYLDNHACFAEQNYRRKKSIGFQNSICRESDMASSEESCSKGLKNVLANTVRGVALAVWGTQPRDRMLIAEMSVSASIGELVQAENTTKQELSIIVERVRATQSSESKSGLKDLLLKSRVLRGTLASINKKRVWRSNWKRCGKAN
jgi:hypothetical protein